jgi:hypothetical protein
LSRFGVDILIRPLRLDFGFWGTYHPFRTSVGLRT